MAIVITNKSLNFSESSAKVYNDILLDFNTANFELNSIATVELFVSFWASGQDTGILLNRQFNPSERIKFVSEKKNNYYEIRNDYFVLTNNSNFAREFQYILFTKNLSSGSGWISSSVQGLFFIKLDQPVLLAPQKSFTFPPKCLIFELPFS
jgi:hypothetical protein